VDNLVKSVLTTGGSAGDKVYAEDVFNIVGYVGNDDLQYIETGINLSTTGTAAWSVIRLQSSGYDFTNLTGSVSSSNSARKTVYYSGSNSLYSLANIGTATWGLVKLTPSGSIVWQKNIAEANGAGFLHLTVDSSENIYVLADQVFSGVSAVILLKFDSSGTLLWTRKLEYIYNSPFYSLSCYVGELGLDSSGNVYVVGYGTYDNAGSPGYSAIVAKFNSSGTIQWQKNLGTATYPTAAKVDSSGNVYVGSYGSLIKLDSAGTTQWQKSLSGGGLGQLMQINTDSSGNIYLATSNGYFHKLDSTGSTSLWAKYYGGGHYYTNPRYFNYTKVTSDSFYVTCVVNGRSNTIKHLAILKISISTGDLTWIRMLKVSGEDSASMSGIGEILSSIDVDASGNLYVYSSSFAPSANSANSYAPIIVTLKDDGSTRSGSLYTDDVSAASQYLTTYSPLNIGLFSGTIINNSGTISITTGSTFSPTNSSFNIVNLTYTTANATLTSSFATYSAVLPGPGGMFLTAPRESTGDSSIVDTVNGIRSMKNPSGLFGGTSNMSGSAYNAVGGIDFGTDGVVIGDSVGGGFNFNGAPGGAFSGTNGTYYNLSFKRSPGFFDIVNYTGTGVVQTISHGLKSVPGFIIIGSSNSWITYHRSLGNTKGQNTNDNAIITTDSTFWNNTDPTSNVFTVGTSARTNGSGIVYTAYVFAHNAPGFGPTGSDSVIYCDTFTTDGSGLATVTSLGWEPQVVLVGPPSGSNYFNLATSASGNWGGYAHSGGLQNFNYIFANSSTETTSAFGTFLGPTPNGFKIFSTHTNAVHTYVAFRRRGQKPATAAKEVFNVVNKSYVNGSTSPHRKYRVNKFTSDLIMTMSNNTSGTKVKSFLTRSINGYGSGVISYTFDTSSANTPSPSSSVLPKWDRYNLVEDGVTANSGNDVVSYCFSRKTKFLDIVHWNGDATGNRAISHNLDNEPDLVIYKQFDNGNWMVSGGSTIYGSGTPTILSFTGNPFTSSINIPSPATNTVLNVGTNLNASSLKYIAFIFGSVPGISKIGKYTGNGTSQTINCGFNNGAAFVLITRFDGPGSNWFLWDVKRGIVSATDPYHIFNTTGLMVNTDDGIDPNSTGFIVNQTTTTDININAATYLYFAIAN
jgi:hypothetical protein